MTEELFPCRTLTLPPSFSYLMKRGTASRQSQWVRVLCFWVQQGQDKMHKIWHLAIWVTHSQKHLSPWWRAALKILPGGLEQPPILALWTTKRQLTVWGVEGRDAKKQCVRLNDFPGSPQPVCPEHYSGSLLETSWQVHCQCQHKEAAVLMGQCSEVRSWTNLRPRKEQPKTLSIAWAVALAYSQELRFRAFLWKDRIVSIALVWAIPCSSFFSKSYFHLHREECIGFSMWSISEPENE